MVCILAALLLTAHAQDPDITDVTAYTDGARQFHIGPFRQDYGVLSNTSIGTYAPYFLIGVPNAHAKITAIQTRRLDASFQAGWYTHSLQNTVPGGQLRVVPLAWTGSWLLSDKLSLHFGSGWTLAHVRGELTAQQIAGAVADVLGTQIGPEFSAQLDGTSLYAGADLTLTELHLAADYRLGTRDRILFTASSYQRLDALVAGGVQTTDDNGTQLQVGPSARFSVPLTESLPTIATLSWQRSWDRFHLRLGIPLSNSTTLAFAIPRAITFYWVLGPRGSTST